MSGWRDMPIEVVVGSFLCVAIVGLVVWAVVSENDARKACLAAGDDWACVPGPASLVCQMIGEVTVCNPIPTERCECRRGAR